MSDHDALLAAILAEPADDTARLVFADWLEENGQGQRAEFIRVQVELARLVSASEGPSESRPHPVHIENLRRRERKLQYDSDERGVNNEFQWLGKPLRSFIYCSWAGFEFRRGFVSWISCSWAKWRDHADAILAAHPVELVKLTTRPTQMWDSALQMAWPRIAFELAPDADPRQEYFMSRVGDPTDWEFGVAEGHPYRSPPVPGDTGASQWRR